MAMRIEVDFARPLPRETRTRLLIAVAGLAKSSRIRFDVGGHRAIVIGEAMSGERLAEALRDEDIAFERISSSLDDDEARRVDELEDPDGEGRERVRPVGRGG